ncbi:hypothetical protein A3D11_00725 [Candidatus Peribacteria bacterium RIFCSPHIGHO2_02_FULL_49_16]|nr:MAG: hypothetical protein A2880_01410 [Candidatus Peribacteria bacterium RIFCSPHIGHO2_01_FULL_49_38]OGJ60053.1 MAG: hypothetical protein A3D11_00725 [Candidatus Peribacteria bacterium RIFCSPHIGHO2_02_FULL_49_16]
MRIPKTTKQFRRQYVKMSRSGNNIAKLEAVMKLLIRGDTLPARYKDHALKGVYHNLRDCHIEGDWLLLYELGTDHDGRKMVIFHATDTHENLFG